MTKIPTILVVGDIMIDHYLWGKCERISPEAPVQVVEVLRESETLGGACNVMNNLIALEADVYGCGVIGDDEVGDKVLIELAQKGVNTVGIFKEDDRPTTKKSRVLASHQQIIRVDRESKKEISAKSEEHILEFFSKNIGLFDAVVLSDYGKGVLKDSLTKELINISKRAGKKVFVDPKGSDFSKYSGSYLMTPNKKEASLASGIEIDSSEKLKEAGFLLKKRYDLEISLITLSEDGIAIFEDEMRRIPTVAKEVYDVTGAGDTVIAALSYAISIGEDIYKACDFANAAAAVVVGKIGCATATFAEITEYRHSLNRSRSEDKIIDTKSLKKLIDHLKAQSRKIVFTNGCFDILHAGHVKYLQEAKSFGDVLILGLNSDDSIKRIKGEGRPINSEDDRAIVLASLESVDYVIKFDEDTPYKIIEKIAPDVLVKGGDYKDREVVGSELSKEVILVDFVEGKSTTKIIEKIGSRKGEV